MAWEYRQTLKQNVISDDEFQYTNSDDSSQKWFV